MQADGCERLHGRVGRDAHLFPVATELPPYQVGGAERADPLEHITEPVLLGLQVIPGLQVDPEALGGAEEAG